MSYADDLPSIQGAAMIPISAPTLYRARSPPHSQSEKHAARTGRHFDGDAHHKIQKGHSRPSAT